MKRWIVLPFGVVSSVAVNREASVLAEVVRLPDNPKKIEG